MRAVANGFATLGWDVTVLSLTDNAWLRESGLDDSLLSGVHHRITRVGIPVVREDLDPDIRNYSRLRARYPKKWRQQFQHESSRQFPEPVFGNWREEYEKAAPAIHQNRKVDLTLVSPQPNVQLAAALKLCETDGVPYAIDFRDGWSLDVVSGREAFTNASLAGQWEERAIAGATAVWLVNEPIREFYATRYPLARDRMRVVRNGFDADLLGEVPTELPVTPPLHFGYLGTASFKGEHLTAIIDAWRIARRQEPLLTDATLEFRGHIGSGFAKGANSLTTSITQAASDGVSFGGPVAKRDVNATYAAWDVLVLALIGGEYVTSGKVYEYAATAKPIVSVHAEQHAAAQVLAEYPLWVSPKSASGLDVEPLALSFIEAARIAIGTSTEEHARALAYAQQFERGNVLAPAIRELSAAMGWDVGPE
jgi:hypothetical protein